MHSGQSFLSGLKWMAIGRLSAQLVSWVGTIYVMRQLAPHDYGLAAICSTVVSLVSMVAEFGIGAGIVQAKTLERSQVQSVLGASLLFGTTGALLMVLAAPAITWYFRAPEALPLVQVSAIHLLLTPLATIPEAYLSRGMQFRRASAVEFCSAIAASIATVTLASLGYGAWALVVGPLIGAGLRAVFLNLAAPQFMLPSFNLRPAAALITFGLKVAVSRVGSYVFSQSDVLVAGRNLPQSALGEYSVAMHLAMLPVSKAMSMINAVAYPAIANMNRDGQNVRPQLLEALRLFSHLLIPVLWGLAAVAPWLIPVLIGPAWMNAVLPLQVVCAVLPLRLINALLSSVLQGMGQAGLVLHNTMTGVVLLLPCFILGAQFGTVGLASGWVVGLPILLILNLHRAHRVLQISLIDALFAAAPALVCSALMALAVITTGRAVGTSVGNPIARLAILVAAGFAAQLLAVWLLDRRSLLRMLNMVRGRRT